jgi:GNAT superfamily N-acetyltransferase
MSIEIRTARLEDAAAISLLNREVQDKHAEAIPELFKSAGLEPGDALAILRQPRNLVFLAVQDGEPAGYIYAELRDLPETPLTFGYRTVHIHHIAVRRGQRRAGIGQALLARTAVAARDAGASRLTADYWTFNEEAAAFFARQGLVPYVMRTWCLLTGN